MLKALRVAAIALLLGAPAAWAQSIVWQDYADPTFGFTAELPLGLFEEVEVEGRPGISLQEVGGDAQLSLYGGPADGMTRDALESRLEAGEDIRNITYRAGGDSWFVLSGHYGDGDETVFYTKVLFAPDHQTFSAFEISFPRRDKPRFEAMVERFEDNFTRPQS